MIFKISIVLCIICALLSLFAIQPINWGLLIGSIVGFAFSIALLGMHNDIQFLKTLHKEEFKNRDRTDIYTRN